MFLEQRMLQVHFSSTRRGELGVITVAADRGQRWAALECWHLHENWTFFDFSGPADRRLCLCCVGGPFRGCDSVGTLKPSVKCHRAVIAQPTSSSWSGWRSAQILLPVSVGDTRRTAGGTIQLRNSEKLKPMLLREQTPEPASEPSASCL